MKYQNLGRPPGVLQSSGSSNNNTNRRRRGQSSLLQEEYGELRDRYLYDEDRSMRQQQQYLVEELLESDEDEMIMMNRDGVDNRRGHLQHFDARDRTPTRRRAAQRGVYDLHEEEEDYYYSDEEQRFSPPRFEEEDEEEQEEMEALMQSAYARIARAREKGQTNVNLTREEMQALERGRGGGRRSSGQQQQQQVLERRNIQQPLLEHPAALVTPPITPATKAKDKIKSSSRSSSAASLTSQKKSSRKSSGLAATATASPPPAKSNSKAKVRRKGSVSLGAEQEFIESAPPGMRLINGPNGIPVYAPWDYPPPPATMTPGRRSRSGSSSQLRNRGDSITPPPRDYPPPSLSTRYMGRPESSSSSLRDDIAAGEEGAYDWYIPAQQRSRNIPPYGYEYADAPLPRPRSQQHVPEYWPEQAAPPVRYASLRRTPPVRGLQRVSTGGSSTEGSSGSSSSEEQGVRVEVRAEEGGGYAVMAEQEEEVAVGGKKGKGKGRDVAAGSGKSAASGSVRKRKGKR